MTDSKLRELERQAAQGGVEAQAKLLLERVRVGDLDKAKLELAAYLGNEASRVALGKDAPEVPEGFREWVLGLQRWGREALARGAVALAAYTCPQNEDGTEILDPDEAAVLRAVCRWILCPCTRHAREADRFRHAASDNYAFELLALVPGWPSGVVREIFLKDAERVDGLPDEWTRETLSEELTAWALGIADSVRDRLVSLGEPSP